MQKEEEVGELGGGGWAGALLVDQPVFDSHSWWRRASWYMQCVCHQALPRALSLLRLSVLS